MDNYRELTQAAAAAGHAFTAARAAHAADPGSSPEERRSAKKPFLLPYEPSEEKIYELEDGVYYMVIYLGDESSGTVVRYNIKLKDISKTKFKKRNHPIGWFLFYGEDVLTMSTICFTI